MRTIGVAGLLCASVVAYRYWPRPADAAGMWIAVARDTNYNIFVDAARMQTSVQFPLFKPVNVFAVWFRTDHRQPRLHEGKLFDREIVRSVIWCDSLWYKVLRVDMSMGGGLPVARQATPLFRQEWRKVTRGGADEAAARAACRIARAR